MLQADSGSRESLRAPSARLTAARWPDSVKRVVPGVPICLARNIGKQVAMQVLQADNGQRVAAAVSQG